MPLTTSVAATECARFIGRAVRARPCLLCRRQRHNRERRTGLGELAGTGSITSDAVTSRFTVTDIVLDVECGSGFASAPANGHYLGIHFNVETTPELAAEEFASLYFTRYDWQAYDANGKRLNDPVGNSWSCLDASQELPSEIGPGQSVSGWIVLDVAATSGSVVLAMDGPTGWEWAY